LVLSANGPAPFISLQVPFWPILEPDFPHIVHSACSLLLAGFLLGLFFDSEDRGSMFLQNVCELLLDYTALHLR
jgi:hypothetical protein